MIHKLLNCYMDASMVADSGEVTALMYVGAHMDPKNGVIQLSQNCLAML